MLDLVLSPIVNFLVEKLAGNLEDKYELGSDVEGKLKKLKQSLIRIHAVIHNADEVEIKSNYLLEWLMELKEAVHEAEDLLDEFEYQRLEQQVAANDDEDDDERRQRKRAKLSDMIHLPNIFKRSTQLERLASIQHRFEELATANVVLPLLQLVKGERSDGKKRKEEDDKRRVTTSYILEPQFVGRTKVLEEIVHLLLAVDDGSASTSSGIREVPVVPVVAPGGFGKTTVARHVFRDTRVVEHFQERLWVHVSPNFDVKRLTRGMIESASSGSRCHDIDSLDRLQQELEKAIGSKRFLLVLDDVWWGDDSLKTEQLQLTEEEWRRLFAPLAAGARGSMVLLTSRTRRVARLPCALSPILLGVLVDDECWEIIKACTFSGDRDPAGYGNLVDIGKQIASKVKGSPLAANAVGGMLRHNMNDDYWSKILDTGLGELPSVMDVLNLSYQHLPPHLRKCFAYCSLFPKGHQFDQEALCELGYMWVAQGFIIPQSGETIEEVGKKCFNGLLSRSFFQIIEHDRVRSFFQITEHVRVREYYVMHDLMNDLARNISKGDCLRYEGGHRSGNNSNSWEDNIPETVRHISVRAKHVPELSKGGCKFGNLRSFIILPADYTEPAKLIIKEVFKQLWRVRVLSLNDDTVKELPDDAGDRMHLRYLYLNISRIKRLPESLCRLYHLQVLSVKGNYRGRCEFPRKMSNLTNLRILNTYN